MWQKVKCMGRGQKGGRERKRKEETGSDGYD